MKVILGMNLRNFQIKIGLSNYLNLKNLKASKSKMQKNIFLSMEKVFADFYLARVGNIEKGASKIFKILLRIFKRIKFLRIKIRKKYILLYWDLLQMVLKIKLHRLSFQPLNSSKLF